jgi:hypothetical protein
MSDFERENINIRYNSNEWGPFAFDLTDMLPVGTTVSSAVIRSFLGNVKKTDDLSDETETTSVLVETASTAVSSPYVYAYFQYAGTTYINTKHTLVFEITLSNSAVTALYFQYINVDGDES